MMRLFSSNTIGLFLSVCLCFLIDEAKSDDTFLLVGNTRADNLVGIAKDGSVLGEFVGGLTNPDHIRIVGDYLYVTVGDTPESSTMYRQNLKTGHVDADFLKGGDLLRPYGFDFYMGRIYVASFLTDKIIIYDMDTGAYIGVFAQGNGTEEGLVNGPNHIAVYNDMLYLTTQGSVATDGAPVYGLASQIAVFDLHTGEGHVFAPQPEPLADSLGFVSMLGIQIFCQYDKYGHELCQVYTTDFAGGLRVYSLEGELLGAISTTYESGAIAGVLSITPEGEIYIPGYVDETGGGVVQRFSAADGTALPAKGLEGALFVGPSKALVRPIGVLALPTATSAPSKGKGMSSSSSKGTSSMMKMMMMGKGKGGKGKGKGSRVRG